MTPLQGSKKITIRGDKQTVTEDYALIEKKDRAGSDGKNIKCPNCQHITRIFNLAWKTRECPSCHIRTSKYEWMIDQLDTWRTPR
tara:strand:+ start:209 stop:463 length:255 start_codon:yes stop_codon:yes gene_type:complete